MFYVNFCTGTTDNDWNINFYTGNDFNNYIANLRVCHLNEEQFKVLVNYNGDYNNLIEIC